tara:strand:+ start:1378 stop:1542 length:165 start_codon:yes stop_codon:yes gene_type:complete
VAVVEAQEKAMARRAWAPVVAVATAAWAAAWEEALVAAAVAGTPMVDLLSVART